MRPEIFTQIHKWWMMNTRSNFDNQQHPTISYPEQFPRWRLISNQPSKQCTAGSPTKANCKHQPNHGAEKQLSSQVFHSRPTVVVALFSKCPVQIPIAVWGLLVNRGASLTNARTCIGSSLGLKSKISLPVFDGPALYCASRDVLKIQSGFVPHL